MSGVTSVSTVASTNAPGPSSRLPPVRRVGALGDRVLDLLEEVLRGALGGERAEAGALVERVTG